nr:hypothetical protein HI13_contig00027-0001 [Ipomoea batatas]
MRDSFWSRRYRRGQRREPSGWTSRERRCESVSIKGDHKGDAEAFHVGQGNRFMTLLSSGNHANQTCCFAECAEFGSSDWTRTSDIRINSPPFYRLNYRGIVRTGRIVAAPVRDVKALFHGLRLSARKSSALVNIRHIRLLFKLLTGSHFNAISQ